MGFFSWVTSDTNKSVSNAWSTRGALPVYLLCPDGTKIHEADYDGYGVFGGKDVYELVAEWNRGNLTPDYLRKPERSGWSKDEEGQRWYERALARHEDDCRMLAEYREGATDEAMAERYGKDWKRLLGIHIACYDEQNEALEFPIKIVENGTLKYNWVRPSKGCPSQGYFYYDEDEDEDW